MPAMAMLFARFGCFDAAVYQPYVRAVAMRSERHFDGTGARWSRRVICPAEGEHNPCGWHHFDVRAAGSGLLVDIHRVSATGAWLELHARAHPARHLVWIGEELEDKWGWRCDADFADHRVDLTDGHHLLPDVVRSVGARVLSGSAGARVACGSGVPVSCVIGGRRVWGRP